MNFVGFKILTVEQWDSFLVDGFFKGNQKDIEDGYIHMCTEAQLEKTITKFFGNYTVLIIAEVEFDALDDTIKWEATRSGELFPHVYGAIPLRAVRRIQNRKFE